MLMLASIYAFAAAAGLYNMLLPLASMLLLRMLMMLKMMKTRQIAESC